MRLRNDVEKWFSNIDGKNAIKTKFDLYYICLMLGLSTGRKSDPRQDGRAAPEFIRNFIDDYKPSQQLITGLLIVAEINMLGIDLSEKDAVRKEIRKLVAPNSPSGLSAIGEDALDKYASGGFDYLNSKRDQKPFHTEEFLRDYVNIIREAIDDNDAWKSLKETVSK